MAKRTDIMKNTQFKVDVSGDNLAKNILSAEQNFKLEIFLAKMMYILVLVLKK